MDGTTLLIYAALGALLLLMLVVGVSMIFLMRALQPELSDTEIRLKKVSHEAKRDKNSRKVSSWVETAAKESKRSQQTRLQRMMIYWPERWGLREVFLQAGMDISFEKFVQYLIVMPFFACAILLLITRIPLFFIAMLGVPFGAVVLLFWRKRKRLKRIQEQLPDSLNMMTSALRAGHSFQSCMNLLGDEVSPPIGEEFQTMNNDLSLGLPVKDSMMKLIEHVNVPDIRMFSTAVLIQRESGGNLAEILDSLSYTIRERFKLRRQISVLTSQARISAYILGAAPFVVFLIMFTFFNDYLSPLYSTSMGLIAMTVAFFMQVIGGYIMYKIVDIRI